MTITTIGLFPGITDIDRMVILYTAKRQTECVALKLLRKDCVAHIAVPRQYFAVIRNVFVVVAAEATIVVHVPNIIGEFFPVHAHFRKIAATKDLLYMDDSAIDQSLFFRCDLRIVALVIFLYCHFDAVESTLFGTVRVVKSLHRNALHVWEFWINPS